MKITFSSNLGLRLLTYSRILILLGIFVALYKYLGTVFALAFIFAIILNDISDIESTLAERNQVEGDYEKWMHTSNKRKQF